MAVRLPNRARQGASRPRAHAGDEALRPIGAETGSRRSLHEQIDERKVAPIEQPLVAELKAWDNEQCHK